MSTQLIQQNIYNKIGICVEVGSCNLATNNMPCDKYFVQRPSLTKMSLHTSKATFSNRKNSKDFANKASHWLAETSNWPMIFIACYCNGAC